VKRLSSILIAGLALYALLGIYNPVDASTPVKIAILDSGCNIGYKEGISLIDATARDYNGHGTLMARIIKEVYPEAELYIVKIVGGDGLLMTQGAVILGLEWAISRGVDVINISLRIRDSQELYKTIKKAYQQGILIVAAAGNDSTRLNELAKRGDISLTGVAYPARYSEVIAVGALDKYGEIFDASIKGEKVEFLCRGYKDGKAGTSVASAYAAGFAAKIISEYPDSNLENIINIMRGNSRQMH
jgi:subtilisin family serine protease